MVLWFSLFRVLTVNLVSRESLETLDPREMLVLLDPLDPLEVLVLRLVFTLTSLKQPSLKIHIKTKIFKAK